MSDAASGRPIVVHARVQTAAAGSVSISNFARSDGGRPTRRLRAPGVVMGADVRARRPGVRV